MTTLSNSFDSRLLELGTRIGRLLAADVRAYLPQQVRDRFADSPALADALDDAALAALKQDTLAAADALAAEVEKRLGPDVWLAARPPQADAGPSPALTSHPPVAEVVAFIERGVNDHLAHLGLIGEGHQVYRLPMRFIDGDNLATLTLNFWKVVSRRHAEQVKTGDVAAAQAHAERKRRWDEV